MKARASKIKNKIRKTTQSDLHEIYEIEKAVQPNPWSLKALKEEIEHPHGKNVVLTTEDNSKVIGYFFLRLGLDSAEIMTLGIHDLYQKQGFGAFLVKEGLKACPGGFDVFLEVSHLNERALNLYKKLGFKIISTRKAYYKDGSDALCMGLKVDLSHRAIAKDE